MSEYGELWNRCVAFHGHACPGLAIGYRAALTAKAYLDVDFSPDEELVCVTENDACGVDAVQVLTGCSLGKGNLLYRPTGKQAFSFFDRQSGRKVRVLFTHRWNRDEPMDRDAAQAFIMTAPTEELFAISMPTFEVPPTARIFTSLVCECCGETMPEPKARLHEGKTVCLDCFPDYSRGW